MEQEGKRLLTQKGLSGRLNDRLDALGQEVLQSAFDHANDEVEDDVVEEPLGILLDLRLELADSHCTSDHFDGLS